MPDLSDIRKKLATGHTEPQGRPVDSDVEPEKVKKGYQIKGGNGGARPGAGRKPSQAKLVKKGIQEWIDAHMHEKVAVTLIGKDGKLKTMKMSRLTGALAKLYEMGMDAKGDADALNKWLDRMLGKAAQVVKGDADEPIRLLIDF